ncbi:hypothetical protein Efla_000962 [Eimeria flavescens]
MLLPFSKLIGDPEPFDWFNKYPALKPILLDAGLQESSSILMLGCGTSTMSENMWDDGYRNITNIDFSPQCISLMQKRCADKPGMTFMVLDVLDLKELAGRSFDFIIDKGTLDCILCGEKSFENIHKALTLISQLLSPGAVYLMMSYGSPMFRLNHLQKAEFGWTVELQTLEKPSLNTPAEVEEKSDVHYIYLCRKHQGPNDGSPEEAPAEDS